MYNQSGALTTIFLLTVATRPKLEAINIWGWMRCVAPSASVSAEASAGC